jgi:hypothetical protein
MAKIQILNIIFVLNSVFIRIKFDIYRINIELTSNKLRIYNEKTIELVLI